MSFAMAIQAVEVFMSVYSLGQQIEIEIIKVEDHKGEFKQISEINKIFKELKSQPILIRNIQQINSLLLITWNVIGDHINDKIKLAEKLTSQYKDVTSGKYSFTLQNGAFLTLNSVLTTFQLYKFLNSKSPKVPNSNSIKLEQLKSRMLKQPIIVEKIQLKGGQSIASGKGSNQIRKGVTQPKGSFKKTSTFQVSQNVDQILQAPSKSSIWSKIKSFGTKAGKVILKGLKFLGFVGMIIGVYFGEIAIHELLNELKMIQKEYGDNGQFKIAEVQIINLITAFAQMVSNLSYATYASVQMIRNSYAVMGLTFNTLNSVCLQRSRQLDPKELDISIQFCQGSNKFYRDLSQIYVNSNSSNQIMKKALQDSSDILKKYLQDYKPMNIFSKLAQHFGNYCSETSLTFKILLINETIFMDFKNKIANKFLNRQTENLKSIQQRVKKDKKLVKSICNSYLSLLEDISHKQYTSIEQYEQFVTISPKNLQEIGNIIASFTNHIYSESANGDKLFNKKFSDFKGSKTYSQILTQAYDLPNTIPIPFENNQMKKKTIAQFNDLVKKGIKQLKNQKCNVFNTEKFTIYEEAPCIFWKQIPNKLVVGDETATKLEFQRAIKYTVSEKESKGVKTDIIFYERKPFWIGSSSLQILDLQAIAVEVIAVEVVKKIPVYRYKAAQAQRKQLGYGERYFYSLDGNTGNGWTMEGIAFYVPEANNSKTVPLHRYHIVTQKGWRFLFQTNTNKVDKQWKYDYIVFNVYSESVPDSVPIYRFKNEQMDGFRYFYTSSQSNIQPGWIYEGIAFWAYEGKI